MTALDQEVDSLANAVTELIERSEIIMSPERPKETAPGSDDLDLVVCVVADEFRKQARRVAYIRSRVAEAVGRLQT